MARASGSALSRLAPWLGLSVIVILVDQLSKVLAERSFAYGARINVLPSFDLTLLYNKGAAFSFLSDGAGWQRWLFTGIGIGAAFFITWLLSRHGTERLFSTALALIMGGALGNVIDRLVHGHVIDFLLVYYDRWYWPAFNVADSAITLGAVLLVLDELLRVRKSK